MRYLLDSDTISDLYNPNAKNHQKILAKMTSLNNQDKVYFSVLTLYEFEYGYANAPPQYQERMQKRIELTKDRLAMLPVSPDGAKTFGKIKKLLKDFRKITSKKNLKEFNIDLILASTAVTESCVLVSSDNMYQDIGETYPDFQYQNWLS